MKKAKKLSVSVIVIVLLIGIAWVLSSKQGTEKISKKRLTNGKYTNGLIETEDGELWEVGKYDYAYKPGTAVKVTFDTNMTKTKKDDRITKVEAKSANLNLVNQYIKNHYNLEKYKVIYISYNDVPVKRLMARKKNKIIYVDEIKSISKGKYGYEKVNGKDYIITYNKEVEVGKEVKSYCIFNPHSHYTDDVVAVVDNEAER